MEKRTGPADGYLPSPPPASANSSKRAKATQRETALCFRLASISV
jgi:hypothetical protein